MNTWERNGWLAKTDELINNELKDGVKTLIKANDKESITLGQEMIRLKIEDTLIEGLNPDQTTAFMNIIEFVRSPKHDGLVLKGYAGTGKTFLVKRVIEYITNAYPYRAIAISAPTNKAVEVLVRNAPFGDATNMMEDVFDGDNQITYATIHKLLGLKEQIDANGNRKFVADKKGNKGRVTLRDFKYLIVDEASMINDEIFIEIMKFHKEVKIIFMGDPAQIPPVGKDDSLPFKAYNGFNFLKLELKQIMRQKGDNAILDYSMKLRENLSATNALVNEVSRLNDKGQGVVFINGKNKDERKIVRDILEMYYTAREFEANPDYMKTIAWTNNVVTSLNNTIRGIRFGEDLPRFVEGDHLVANGPIFRENDYGYGIEYTTSQEFIVTHANVEERTFKASKIKDAPGISFTGKYWEVYTNLGVLFVLHEDELPRFKAEAKKLKQMAITEKNKYMWVQYFTFLKWNDDIMYNYAITAHKSQGSTYDNTLVIEENINLNKKVVERNRIKYTAYTRAKEKLYVLR